MNTNTSHTPLDPLKRSHAVIAGVIILAVVPFLLLELFPSALYVTIDIVPYLVFHNCTEFFGIVVSLSIFGLGWFSYDQNKDQHSLFLSTAFLAIGLMDFMHTLGYFGMPAFITPNPVNKATQFWIAVRLFSACVFLASGFVYPDKPLRWLSKSNLLVAALYISGLAFITITFPPSAFPAAFIDGVGLTPFKKNTEYVIICLLMLAATVYWKRMLVRRERASIYFLAAFVLSIFSELVFTFYKSAFDSYNMLGHVYKVVAFYLIYRGVFILNITVPYEKNIIANEKLRIEIAERKEAVTAQQKSEERMRLFFERQIVGMAITSPDKGWLQVNDKLCRMLGYSPEEIYQLKWSDMTYPDDLAPDVAQYVRLISGEINEYSLEKRFFRKDGAVVYTDLSVGCVRHPDGSVDYVLALLLDITERKLSLEALRNSEERHRTILQTAMDGILLIDVQGNFIEVNTTYCLMSGYSMQELLAMNVADIVDKEAVADMAAHIRDIMERGEHRFESRHRRKDGDVYDVEVSVQYQPNHGEQMVVFVQDISGRKRSETERTKLQGQLYHAQKMESIGRLAGGVAHDFNNMLTVILGHAQLGLMRLDPAHPVTADLVEISKSAERSADLTRQLLAFARKQTIAPKVLDLNETLKDMLKMLQRLIGEDIDLVMHPAAGLYQVRMDPSQIDQILANLCVNARDAITSNGRIIIESENRTIDAGYCAANREAAPGEYVQLSVSDNGCGMGKEVLPHIFEPFFTTKKLGKGTGLGLATVYGIVKQNGGFINIYSEPGKGTTFQVHIPRHVGTGGQVPTGEAPQSLKLGKETILLVEDEQSILNIASLLLENQGYTVLPAATPSEAIRLAKEHAGGIHLLMTDVIMPGMNGHDLADSLSSFCPHVKRLFMSGYTGEVISKSGVLEEGVHFIQKPFTLQNMAAKVREVLDSR